MQTQCYRHVLLSLILVTSCSTRTALQHSVRHIIRPAPLSSLVKNIHGQPQPTMHYFSTCSVKSDKPTNTLENTQSVFLGKQLPKGTEKHIFMCGSKGAIAGCLIGIPSGAYFGFINTLQDKDTPSALQLPGGFLTDLTVQTVGYAVTCGSIGAFWAALGGSIIGAATLPLLHLAHKRNDKQKKIMPNNVNRISKHKIIREL